MVDRLRFERVLRRAGCEQVAGLDEAGRGALAGPLVAAAVILPAGFDVTGLRDSKQMSRGRRETEFRRITAGASFVVDAVEPERIDRDGLKKSNIELFRRLAIALDPDFALIDGIIGVDGLPFPSRTITKGDERSASIAAASIIAKVSRDRIMDDLDEKYPGYGFGTNHGYGPIQLEPLESLGPIPGVHRFSIGRVERARR